jgi:uncharacterized protein (DUF58 family)
VIDPRVAASLRDLELAARRVVAGLLFGVHPSRAPGAGLEFSRYRSYQPGDDPRRVDWKLYARSDRYFVREADTETSVTVRLVLDASASMAQVEAGVTKLDYARLLAAALALLVVRQGDAVGLVVVDGAGPAVVPAQRGQRHLHRLLRTLERVAPAGAWPGWSRLERTLTAGGRRSLTVVLSDLCEREEEVRTAALKLAAMGDDVMLLHVLARADLTFPYQGGVTFEELETGRRVAVDADAARAAYRERLTSELRTLRAVLADAGVDYDAVTLDEPPDRALRRLLQRRARAA